jgi:hypothetical protein
MAYLGYGLGYNGLVDPALGVGLGGVGYPGLGYPGLGYGLGYDGLWGGAGLANIATTERFGLAVGNEVQNFGLANIAATERNGDKNWAATYNIGLHNLMSTERHGCANLVATERNYGLLSSSFERGVGSINTNAQLIANQQALQAAQNDAANATRAKDIQVQLMGSTSALALQISDSKNQIQKDIADSKCALELLTVQKTNELALQAERNNCQTNAHISEGFCNTNKNIADSESTILAAINTNETARLKEALAYANTVNLINRHGHHHHHHTVGNFL